MHYRKDLYPGIVLALISIAYLALTTQIQVFAGHGATPLTNQAMPRFWGVFLLILSVVLIVRGVRTLKKEKASGVREERAGFVQAVKNNREVILTFVALAIYIAGLQPIGFTVMSALYVFAQNLILTHPSKINAKSVIIALVFGIVVAVLVDFLFVQFLHVLLPRGLAGF